MKQRNLTRMSTCIGAAVLASAMALSGCGVKKDGDGRSMLSRTTSESTASTTVPTTTPTTTTQVPDTSDTGYSVPTFDDIGEAYHKPIASEDIVIDKDTGLQYAKNQLLVSCKVGTTKDDVKDIFDKLDADIVGYIELTGDFQIEFRKDMELSDLQYVADYLNSYPFVLNVTLNLVVFYEEDADLD